nr:putative integron gene cassette protein [uncultured bacterium]
MNNDDLDQILELREPQSVNDEVRRRPIFYFASVGFSVIAIWLVIYLFVFHKSAEGMAGMFDGLQYLLAAVVSLGVGFICTTVGFFRSEKTNWLIRIHSAFSLLFALLMLILMSR